MLGSSFQETNNYSMHRCLRTDAEVVKLTAGGSRYLITFIGGNELLSLLLIVFHEAENWKLAGTKF